MIDRGKYVRLTNGERKILEDLCDKERERLESLLAAPVLDEQGRRERKRAKDRQRQLRRIVYQIREAHIEPVAEPGELTEKASRPEGAAGEGDGDGHQG